MIPLSDVSRRPTTFPVVTFSIIVINVIVFIVELFSSDATLAKWTMVPAHVSHGRDLITVVTSTFMHASWSHIIGNMVFFWAFGPEIEDEMGPLRYALFYFLGGLAAAAAQVLADPNSTVPSLGASGAIAAVMGAFIVTYPRDEIRSLLFIWVFVRVTYIPAVVLIGIWFLTQLISAGSVVTTQQGGVAYMAHIGGFLFGAVFARLFATQARA